MAHHGDLGVFHDVADKFIGAARDQEIHVLVAGEELVDLAVGFCLEQAAFRQTGADHRVLDKVEKHAVGVCRLLAALEDGAVAALHAKGRDLYKRVRTRFKDHADDTDRHCGTIERQIFVKLAGEGDLIERICERFQLAQAADAVAQLAVVEFQAFARRASDTIFVSSSEILRVGSEDLLAMRFQCEGNLFQRNIARFIRRCGQRRRSQLHATGFFFDIHRKTSL